MRLWDAEIPSSEETKYRTIEQRREVEDLVSGMYLLTIENENSLHQQKFLKE